MTRRLLDPRRLPYLLALGLACADATTDTGPPVDPSAAATREELAAQAQAFQRDYEAELRADDASFLTAIAAHYLAPGEQRGIELGEGGAVISVAAEDEALSLTIGAGEVQRVAEREQISIDARYLIAVSRQERRFRVLIHDREAELRTSFAGIAWFPITPERIVEAAFTPTDTREPTLLQTSRGLSKTLWRAGEAHFELDGRALQLTVFAYAPEPSVGEPLLIPFRDATSGRESYAAGRYLEPTLPAGGSLRLDFNRATNPLCAYSEHYNCPMPPRFNELPVAIRAGARDH